MSTLEEVIERLARIEQALQTIVAKPPPKEWYSVAEASKLLGKAKFTIRENCRLGRILAKKLKCGRGTSQDWVISHDEIERVRNEGLLPDPRRYRHVQ
jgi:hypothetical protein